MIDDEKKKKKKTAELAQSELNGDFEVNNTNELLNSTNFSKKDNSNHRISLSS